MRCVLNSSSRPLFLPSPLLISLLGLPCLAVAHHLPTMDDTTIMVLVLPPSTEGVAPTSPMTLPLHHGLHVRFVESWATLPFGAINGKIRHLHMNLSTVHRLIILPLPYLLKTTGTSMPGQLITLPVSSSILISLLKTTMVRIRSV
jgi:hypothetical protein